MNFVDPKTMDLLWHDAEPREVRLRDVITARLRERPTPKMDEHIVATYFFAFRSTKLADAVEEISYHATIGVKHPPKGSLLEQCAAIAAGIDEFDATGRIDSSYSVIESIIDEQVAGCIDDNCKRQIQSR